MAEFSITAIKRRPVSGYGNKYEVGNDGSVWRDGRQLVVSRGYVNLSYGGSVAKVKVAFLVARAFLPNGEGKEWVRHKDRDVENNCVGNLEWCERKEELRGRRAVRDEVTAWRKEDGMLVGSWPSLKEACRALGIGLDHARKQLRGQARSVKGYVLKA